MRRPFRKNVEPPAELRLPAPSQPPKLNSSDLAALYRGARVGGDFFESVKVGNDRLIFVLLDIAGRRDQAIDIAASLQELLRRTVPEMFANLM
jgi:hypothetical protein